MGGIFGIVHRDGATVARPALGTMRNAMAHWGRDGGDVWLDGCAGLGHLRTYTTDEARYECLPRADRTRGIVFTAAGRVDNREELSQQLSVVSQQPPIADTDFIYHAYLRWGNDCVNHIYGDWTFAAWQPAERQMVLARDHFGNTSLYYYADVGVFAFASDRRALLALKLAPMEMDELYLAQVLISWPAYHGERTIYKPIHRLPPAHTLTVTPDRLEVREYWRLADAPIVRLPRREDYVAAFREVFDQAVCARLRASPPDPISQNKKHVSAEAAGVRSAIAVSLSGGLDSGSVTASAARFLRAEGKRLSAFTSVPRSDTRAYVGQNFGDEFPYAQATARFAGNVDHFPITAATITPIQAIRRMLEIHGEPAHAAGNFFWILELQDAARAQGSRVLLTGQMGNAGISWEGDVFSQSLAFQLRQIGGRKWTKEQIKRATPPSLLNAYQRLRADREWYRASAIQPDFARRLNLLDRRLNDHNECPSRDPRAIRFQILQPGRSFVGALNAQMGAAGDLEIRDPTADPRVLAFTLSVPDVVFMDPATGLDRWLIREAMKDRLPDEVRLNRKRGRQAGDLVPRLRACAGEVEAALAELGRGPATEYVDVPYMRQVWEMIQTQDTPEAFRKSITVLTRGIMAGLFVNQLAVNSEA